ncbi:MAG TPA: hypothetical protein VGO64_09375, partial [Candidatus Limnocylindrales bacterium]|nr:hypothetical protein [Candidatus Limnocylindrales bacterium]
MSERGPDRGFAVVPHRLGGGGGRDRRRRLVAAIVLLIAGVLIAVAFIGPRLADRPNFDVAFFATPTPRSTPTPSPSSTSAGFATPLVPTPLPALTKPQGVTIDGRIAVWTDSFRLLDLATGIVVPSLGLEPGRDVMTAAPGGDGWICVCMEDHLGAPTTLRDVLVVRVDRDGREQSRTLIGTLGPGSTSDQGPQTSVDVAADGRSALLAVGIPSASAWVYSIATIDLIRPSLGPMLALGSQQLPPTPSPTPTPLEGGSPGAYIYGPFVSRSPSGGEAFVWSTLQIPTADGTGATTTIGWRVAIDGGKATTPTDAPGLTDLPPYCGAMRWLAPASFVAVCSVLPGPTTSDGSQVARWNLAVFGPDGVLRRRIDLPDTSGYYSDPLMDSANEAVWLWDPMALTLVRIDTRSGTVGKETYDPLAEAAPGSAAFGGTTPEWAPPATGSPFFSLPQLVGAPDGRRLYALG